MTEAFIYEAIRTPRGRGKKDGSLHGTKALDLVVGLIDELRAEFGYRFEVPETLRHRLSQSSSVVE